MLFSLINCLFILFVLILLILASLKLYIKVRTRWNYSYTCLVGKTVIITGANSGIGYYAALDFAKRGARVILACRSKSRAEEAKNNIISATGNPNVVVKLLDLTLLKSVRDFCKDINETETRLDILVNNAGIMGTGSQLTKDGLQIQWQVNYLSPFLLTNLLVDKLKKSAPSRVVILTSIAAKQESLNVYETIGTYPDGYFYCTETAVYGGTKLANILFSRVLAKRLAGSGVTVYALHPGITSTDLMRTSMSPMFKKLIYTLSDCVMKTAEEGAQTTIFCAVSKEVENESGKLYDECREIPMYNSCLDMSLAERVYKKSEEMLKLHEKIN